MKAIILAGGEGRRLRPLTDKLPKPMLPVMNQPLIVHIFSLLKRHNITEIAICLGYKGEIIREYCKDGEDFGISITYFQESEPLGTAGAVKKTASFFNEDCIVISGDVLSDANLTSAIHFHNQNDGFATLILKETDSPLNYGLVVTDETGKIRHFYNHPDWDEVRSDTVSTGIYIMRPAILDLIPNERYCDFATDLFPTVLSKNLPLFGYVSNNYWCDIGDISAYRQCHKDAFRGKVDLGLTESALSDGVLIGNDCEIADNVRVERYSVIGNHTKIGSGSTVKDSIVWSGSEIPENTDIFRTIVCGSEKIHSAPAETDNKALPCCLSNSFSGILNDDITPEFIIQLSSVYAEVLKPGAKILLSLADDTRYLMPKFAFLSGLIAGGARVYNLVGATDRCMARFALRKLSMHGGMHVQLNGEKINIELFNADGTPIDKQLIKTIRRRLASGDFKYTDVKHFHPPVNVHDIPLYYFKDLIKTTPCKRLNFSVGICTQSAELKHNFKKIAAAFGMSVLFTNDENYLQHLIVSNKLNFGVLIGDNGKCALFDEHGKVLSGDAFYGLVTLIVCTAVENANVLMPQHVSDSVTSVAESLGGSVTRVNDYTLESALLERNNAAARLQHNLIFDPVFSVVRICEFLFLNRTTLSHICSLLPSMHKIVKSIDCPNHKKAGVMKQLLSSAGKEKTTDLTEGLKIIDKRGWILITPDNAFGRLHILAESADEEYACELAGDVCKIIESLTK